MSAAVDAVDQEGLVGLALVGQPFAADVQKGGALEREKALDECRFACAFGLQHGCADHGRCSPGYLVHAQAADVRCRSAGDAVPQLESEQS